MMTAKINKTGNSQTVKLPEEYKFSENEVLISKIGKTVLLIPKKNKWENFFKAIDMFSEDFMQDGRATEPFMKREELSECIFRLNGTANPR